MNGLARRIGKKEEKSPFYVLLKWLVDLAVVIGAAIFAGIFLGEQMTVTGYSMEPALSNGDAVLIDRISYHFRDPERNDIVVFSPKSDSTQYYIKRIVALPGETVQIKNGQLYINGEVQKLQEDMGEILNAGLAGEKVTLAADEYFVLGDNWNHSEDSRFASVGNVKRSNIIGKAWLEVTTLEDIALVE